MQQETPGQDSSWKPSSKKCPYCNEETLRHAREGEAHFRLAKSITCGTRLALWKPSIGRWSEGLVLDEINTDLWEVKCSDDDPDDMPKYYHLIHFKIKDVTNSNATFPLRSVWKGGQWHSSLVTKNDITCKVSFIRQEEAQQLKARGTVFFGREGPICTFTENMPSENEHIAGIRAILASMRIVEAFWQQCTPRALKIWIVSGSKYSLEQIWGQTNIDQYRDLTTAVRSYLTQFNSQSRLTIFPTCSQMTDHEFNINDSLIDVSKNQAWATVGASKLGGLSWELKIREGTTSKAEKLPTHSGKSGQRTVQDKRQSTVMNKRRRRPQHMEIQRSTRIKLIHNSKEDEMAWPSPCKHELESTEKLIKNRPLVEPGREWCPVGGCRNNGNKGFKRLPQHLESQHGDVLKGENDRDKRAVIKALEKINRYLCKNCHRIWAKTDWNNLCGNCWRQRLTKDIPERICLDITTKEQDDILYEIIAANKTTMRVLKCIPRSLRQWWSRAVTTTLTEWVKASTVKQALRAIERWSKLKAALIRPLRGGRRRKSKGALNRWQTNLQRDALMEFGRKCGMKLVASNSQEQ